MIARKWDSDVELLSIPSGAKPAWECIVELPAYTVALILMIGVITIRVITIVCGVIGKT